MGYNIAFSGLSATAEAIDVTSNNIANAQTVGYKAGEFMFADEFFRAQDPQSMDRSGMGTARQGIRRDMNYGTVTDTQNPLDVALTGPGMFVLAKNTSGTVPTQTPDTFQFTRNGQFGVDANNRIVNENGMYVVGYPANVDGKSINKAQFSILTLDQTPMPAKQTTTSTIAMNLDNRGNPIQATFDPTQVNSYTQTTSQTVYDAGGNQHTLSTYYAKQNPATLYFYPVAGGTDPTTTTVYTFNPNQDISAAADNFTATANLTSVPSGVDAAHSLATTATPSTGSAVTNETLSGVKLTAYPAGQNSTYQMTLSDGTQLMVTAQYTTDKNGQTAVRYGYAVDRYNSYLTVDGINVNRSIATSSQIGQGYAPSSSLTGQISEGITSTGAQPQVPLANATDTYDLSALANTTLSAGDKVIVAGLTYTVASGGATGAQAISDINGYITSYLANPSTSTTLANGAISTGTLNSGVIGSTVTTPGILKLSQAPTASTLFSPSASYAAGTAVTVTGTGLTYTVGAGGATGAQLANDVNAYITSYLANAGEGKTLANGTVSGALNSNIVGTSVTGAGALRISNNTPTATLGSASVSGFASTISTTFTAGASANNVYNLSGITPLNIGDKITVGGITYTATQAGVNGSQVAGDIASYIASNTFTSSYGSFSGAANSSITGASNSSGTLTISLQANSATLGTASIAGNTPTISHAFDQGTAGKSKIWTVAINGGGTAQVTVDPSGKITNVALSGGSGYTFGQSIVIPAGALGVGSSAVTLPATITNSNIAGVLDANYTTLASPIGAQGLTTTNPTTPIVVNLGTNSGGKGPYVDVLLTVNGTNITGYSVTSESGPSNVIPLGTNQIVIPANTNGSLGPIQLPIANTDFVQTTVSNVSVGGALTGSANAGNYTIGSQNVVGGLSGSLTPPSSIAGLGGIAGTYTVQLQSSGGTGTGGVATINYGGNGTITSIQLSGGSGYSTDTISIPAGSLGAGSGAVQLGTIGSANLVNGTQLTLSSGGSPIASAQTVAAGSAGGVQTFSFSNGITFTLNTPVGDTAAGIASGLSGRVITVANNPVGTMAFVAGKNIDGLQRDQFGVPAYTTKTSLSTTVGTQTRVNQLAITIDSTDMTAYSAAQSTYTNTQDGNTQAQLTAYTIDNSGILQATYDNGQTLMKGQLAIANFNNTAGLIPVGNNSFEMSGITGLQSGDALYGTANSGNLGAIRSKAVESSNVDLTSELVKLMTLQRQYTANSQAVKVEAATIVDDAIRIGQ